MTLKIFSSPCHQVSHPHFPSCSNPLIMPHIGDNNSDVASLLGPFAKDLQNLSPRMQKYIMGLIVNPNSRKVGGSQGDAGMINSITRSLPYRILYPHISK
jgi:hypothetical protein